MDDAALRKLARETWQPNRNDHDAKAHPIVKDEWNQLDEELRTIIEYVHTKTVRSALKLFELLARDDDLKEYLHELNRNTGKSI